MKKLILSALLLVSVSAFAQKQYTLQSPDKAIIVTVEAGEQLTYSVTHGNTCVLAFSPIGMQLGDGTMLGTKPVVKNAKTRSVNQTLQSPLYKKAQIPEVYEELALTFKGNYKVVFRAYNEGMAYRFETDFRNPIIVENETADKQQSQQDQIPFSVIFSHGRYPLFQRREYKPPNPIIQGIFKKKLSLGLKEIKNGVKYLNPYYE